MKRILKITLYVVLLVAVLLGGIILWAIVTDYKPEPTTALHQSNAPSTLSDTAEYSFLLWNIGYCGLSAEMDFFYDGGKNVRPDEKTSINNLKSVIGYLKDNSQTDFFLFNEIDINSHRSYGINQCDSISAAFASYKMFFGKNYDVSFVPVPWYSPMGGVESGVMTLSRYEPKEAVRLSLPGQFDFPTGLFMLDRCLLVTRFPGPQGKEVVIVNGHLSAYDDGSIRKEQLMFVKDWALAEYQKGNYVIVGADWNQCPPNFKPNFTDNIFDDKEMFTVESDLLPADWRWASRNEVPTNRRVDTPYNPATSRTTVIDFYLLSPNVELKAIQNIHLNFSNSDHNPVKLRVKLTVPETASDSTKVN